MDGEITVWDSLAIGEYLHEKFPQKGLWPKDAGQRARARSVAAEMHSGFANLRNDCSMKIVEQFPYKPLRAETQADVDRIIAIWEECLKQSGGPWLFGKEACLADAFYAPVVMRFKTYGVVLPPALAAYCERVCAHPAVAEWVEQALAEPENAPLHDAEMPD